MTKTITTGSPRKGRPWLMETIAAVAVALSAGIAGIGVLGIVGLGSLLAVAGTVALVVGTFLTEAAASRLPVHAEARASEGGVGGWIKSLLVVAGFIALTAWNVTAGHMGMAAINAAGIADKRAPMAAMAAKTQAARETAEEALRAFDERAARSDAALNDGLKGAFAQGIVSASVKALKSSNADQEALRSPLVKAVSEARAADKPAHDALAAFDAVPQGRPDSDLWSFALVLELLKGALVWFASSSERKTRAQLSAEIVALAPKSPADMTEQELEEMKSRGASLTMTATWELRRRARVA